MTKKCTKLCRLVQVLKPLEKIQVACDNTGIIMLSVLGALAYHLSEQIVS